MQTTEILWTEKTWNPMSGCAPVSEGCRHCYARTLAENKRGTRAFPNGFDLTIRPHKLREPYRLREPSLIFVNSMSDMFQCAVTDEYRGQIIDVIRDTPQHRYQVLTKRPDTLLRYSQSHQLPPNFWAGVTIESQRHTDRAGVLRQVDATIRFLSVEPMLSPVELDLDGISWVIVGGESGCHLMDGSTRARRGLSRRVNGKWFAREDRTPWVRSIRDQCARAGVPFFFKQWGGSRPHSAGRDLDGRTWDEYPNHIHSTPAPFGLFAS